MIPAGEFDEVKIILGLYHGTQPLFSGSILESRSVDTINPDWQQEMKFDITLLNLPPASKLCCSIHFHRRRTPLLVSVRKKSSSFFPLWGFFFMRKSFLSGRMDLYRMGQFECF